jgi:AraC-like DNA-binding protein
MGVVQPDESNRFNVLADRIRQTMEEREPYLDPEFTLEDLVQLLGVPKHHVYYCLNTILKVKFTQLRTEYRVLHAKQLIDQGATRDKTLEAIGMEAGFSSRGTFISAFREVTGKTPSDYVKSELVPKT